MARRIRFVAGDDKKRLRTSLAALQVYYCYVAGRLMLRRRSRLTASQVTACCVAGHGVQCGRSAFLGRTCDTICLTAAISVAGPQQRIGPATLGWETCDTRVADLRRCVFPRRPRTPRSFAPTPRLPAPRSPPLPLPSRSRLPPPSLPPHPAPVPHPVPSRPHPLPCSRTPGSASETLRNTLIY